MTPEELSEHRGKWVAYDDETGAIVASAWDFDIICAAHPGKRIFKIPAKHDYPRVVSVKYR